jgi:hypothetical protein
LARLVAAGFSPAPYISGTCLLKAASTNTAVDFFTTSKPWGKRALTPPSAPHSRWGGRGEGGEGGRRLPTARAVGYIIHDIPARFAAQFLNQLLTQDTRAAFRNCPGKFPSLLADIIYGGPAAAALACCPHLAVHST